ncbi:hypothetical protein AKO1_010584 [Acrasis kona]|uniref:Uncharacterized protein n=1 Tax=Acrasis kona TaxID=1008807 RepID=A0AAW2ZJM4_9EUKA
MEQDESVPVDNDQEVDELNTEHGFPYHSLIYISSGFLFVYLSQQLWDYFKPWLYKNEDVNSIDQLILSVFPFSYIPGSTPQSEIKMNFEKFEQLVQALSQTENCKRAVYEYMLLNYTQRVLTEKAKPTKRETQSCLWLILHCLLSLQNVQHEHNINTWLLRIFHLDDFYQHLELERTVESSISSMRAYKPARFSQPIEIVWLSYAIDKSTKKAQHVDRKHLFLLENKSDLYDQIRFTPVKNQLLPNVSTPKTQLYDRNELKTSTSLNSHIGMESFERFITHSKIIFSCEHSSLVKLALVCFGQLFATCDDHTVGFLLQDESIIKVTSVFEKLILCQDEQVLIVLGKTIFTSCVRDSQFLAQVLKNSTLINEIVQLALFSDQDSIKIQYLNVLFLILLYSENISQKLVQSKQANLLSQLCIMMFHPHIHINFTAIQLLYGICQYQSLHSAVISHSDAKIHSDRNKNSIIQVLKHMCFSPHASLRYYGTLVWDCLVNPSSNPNNLVFDNRNVRYLCKDERLLNLFVLMLKEELEPSIKRTLIQVMREMCSRSQNDYEKNILTHQFNVPFELVEILRSHMKFLMNQKDKNLQGEAKRHYHQVISLVASSILLLGCLTDGDENIKELMVQQHQVNRYITDFLNILNQQKQPFYDQMAQKIHHVSQHVFSMNSKSIENKN